jgi:inhibitor of KinA
MNCKVKSVSSNEIIMQGLPSYTIFPLGDSALTIDFGNLIDLEINKSVVSLFHHLSAKPLNAMTESVPAYSSLTIYYNFFEANKKKKPHQTAFEWMKQQAEKMIAEGFEIKSTIDNNIRIPVCYEDEFSTDINTIAEAKGISAEEFINIHTSKTYKVYMLGFLPGFAYMGEVDEKISHARKPQPQMLKAGSVGIAGHQTGIYPLDSPGGWQIIGRTPLELFNKNNDQLTLLNAGDSVQFYSITKHEFEDIKARNT